MKMELSYSNALLELERIVDEIEDDSMQLDKLAEKVKQAYEIVQFCESRLRIIETDVKAASNRNI